MIKNTNEKYDIEKLMCSQDDEIILGENKFPFFRLKAENDFNGLVEIYNNEINKIGNIKIRFIIIDYENIPDDFSDLENLMNNQIKNVNFLKIVNKLLNRMYFRTSGEELVPSSIPKALKRQIRFYFLLN